ncbi:MAG: YraN family protein [Synergistes sp.]|nr:YraN family protein [Synergistes sp.]
MHQRSFEKAALRGIKTSSDRNLAAPVSKPLFSSDTPHLAKGMLGEDTAAAYLENIGFILIGRNIRTGRCEIDILAKDRDEIVFVEVRTRSRGWIMSASESVGPKKIANLMQAAGRWAEMRNYCGFWRIDLVAVTLEDGKEPLVEHIRNITEPLENE